MSLKPVILSLCAEPNCETRQYIRIIGEDIKKNEIVLRKHTILSSGNIGAAAMCGKSILSVFKPLKAGILTSGDELIDIDSVPDGDKIRASNIYSIITLMKESGVDCKNYGIVKTIKRII